ncbi:MAG: sigma-70 family RNA polymerase sigma factor [Acidimicrobiia bacterium]|nr:sigma-70 family RNA polymerase sigma factor [Acidimicrobiia bacterium]
MAAPDPDFERLFLAHYDGLVKSLTVITGDRELARDCVQDAFIKASASWPRVRRYDDPASWIRRVAINRSRDLHRAGQRRRKRERLVAPPADGPAPDRTGEIPGLMRLVDLLRDLPERQQITAALFYIGDLPVAEIATTLGVSEGAVKFNLSQARTALRAIVEHQDTGDWRHG